MIRRGALPVFVLVLALLMSTAAFGAAEYSVSIPGSIDTPEKTVTVEGDTWTVSEVARVQQGDDLEVETSGPDGDEYRVYAHGIEDGSQYVQDTVFVWPEDDGTISFNTSNFEPGSYVVSVYDEESGSYYDPHPVVVPAFEVDVDAPSSVAPDASFNVSINTERIESGPSIHDVELVFSNDDTTKRVSATETDGEYTASVSLSEPADWQVYAAVESDEDALQGGKELIGISDPVSVQVKTQNATTTTTTTTTSSGGDGGTGGGETDKGTKSTTASSTTMSTTTTISTTEVSTTTVTATSTDSTTSVSTSSTTPTANSTTSSDVISPNNSTSTPSPQSGSSNGVAGGIPFAIVALLASTALLIRQSS